MTKSDSTAQLNVLYDLTMLGIAYRDSKQFGLSRVAEMWLDSLLERSDLNLTGSCHLSFGLWYQCERMLRAGRTKVPIDFLVGSYSNYIRRLGYVGAERLADGFGRFFGELARSRTKDLAEKVLEKRFSGINRRELCEIEIYHSCYHFVPDIIKSAKHISAIITIHDIIPALFPGYCGISIAEAMKLPRNFEFGLHSSLGCIDRNTWVIFPSESTRRDVMDFLGEQLDPEKSAVIPWAASDAFYPCLDPRRFAALAQKYQLPSGNYLLTLSSLEPHKNIDHVIRTFTRLVGEVKVDDLNLIIAGGHGLHSTEVLAAAGANPALSRRIVYAGYIDDDDLACLYSNAMAFIFVPHYEGFGLPPLEAMQCGVPVIASNTSSVPEVVGDAGTLVQPDDEEGLLEAILALYRCPSDRAELSAKSLRQSRKFSWAATAEKTAELYRRARGKSRK